VYQERAHNFVAADLRAKLVQLIRRHPITSNHLVWAVLAGTLVWFADQPTLDGYQPLFAMFWDPGLCRIPNWDRGVLLLSWLVTTLFCHIVLFGIQRARRRHRNHEP